MVNKKRLIDVNPFMKAGWHLVRTGKNNEYLASLSLADVPTVDAVEVVHGRWIKEKLLGCEPFYLCSVCEKIHDQDYNYCNNCGAKMDGDRNA